MTGLERIAHSFAIASGEGRAALMPYFTLGYPTPDASLEIIVAVARSGADLIELGMPFSDPLADGPTIQRSTQTALAAGTTLTRCLELVKELRGRGVQQSLLLMGYINPILTYGVERFAADAARAGADGLIVPDLPPEEGAAMEAACQTQQLALVYLLSPTSPLERLALVTKRTTGFLYLVSLSGVTGARDALASGLQDFVGRVREAAVTPVAVGFGISTPAQAQAVGELADGVIVGSALIDAVEGSVQPAQAAALFVQGLREALEKEQVG